MGYSINKNLFLMNYAIVELGGKQIWIEEGKFYDVDKMNAFTGSTLKLNRVLLIHKQHKTHIGHPYVSQKPIKVSVLKHFNKPKIIIYKMKSKKKTRRKHGFRKSMTRILIHSIIIN